MGEEGPSNMAVLAAVNFRFQRFVKPKDPIAERQRDKNTQLGAKLEGVKIQKFYEEVLSSESKGAKPQTSESLKRKAEKIPVTQTKFLKVKPSLQLQTPQPSLQNTQQAFRAAQENDVKVIRDLFRRDERMAEVRDAFNWTLLMVAASENSVDVVKFLLSQDSVNVYAVESRGRNAFHMAKKKGYTDVAKLIENKVSQRKSGRCVQEPKPVVLNMPSECQLCNQSFKNDKERLSHLSSTLHQFQETKALVDSDTLRPHFVIPEANRGFQIMLGSGWDKKGLGPTGSGKLYPVKTVLKKDRRGLGMASEDGAQKKEAKVTHFDANDASSVADPSSRRERKKTLCKKYRALQLTKEKAKEIKHAQKS